MTLSKKNSGFTLIELIMTIVIVSTLSVVAVSSFQNIPRTQAQFAADKIRSDIRYIQQFAVQSQLDTVIIFVPASDAYVVFRETAPSSGSFVLMQSPKTKQNYVEFFNTGDFEDIGISGVSGNDPVFGPNNHGVLFNEFGAPFWFTGATMTTPSFVTVNGQYRVHFERQTGKIEVETL